MNSGGLVTLDISQEVSNIDTTAPQTTGASTRPLSSSESRAVPGGGTGWPDDRPGGPDPGHHSGGNQGIPWLKDIPSGGSSPARRTIRGPRTEFDAAHAAGWSTISGMPGRRPKRAVQGWQTPPRVPQVLQGLKHSGSSDPGERVRRDLRLQPDRPAARDPGCSIGGAWARTLG